MEITLLIAVLLGLTLIISDIQYILKLLSNDLTVYKRYNKLIEKQTELIEKQNGIITRNNELMDKCEQILVLGNSLIDLHNKAANREAILNQLLDDGITRLEKKYKDSNDIRNNYIGP